MRKLFVAVVAMFLISAPAMAELHGDTNLTGRESRDTTGPTKAQVDKKLDETCAAFRKIKEQERATSSSSFLSTPASSSLGASSGY